MYSTSRQSDSDEVMPIRSEDSEVVRDTVREQVREIQDKIRWWHDYIDFLDTIVSLRRVLLMIE